MHANPVRQTKKHIDRYFPADLADELTLHDDGLVELSRAIVNAAKHLSITPEQAMRQLSAELTTADHDYIRGDLRTAPTDAAQHLAAQIEGDHYLVRHDSTDEPGGKPFSWLIAGPAT